jgi:hypothetical protein
MSYAHIFAPYISCTLPAITRWKKVVLARAEPYRCPKRVNRGPQPVEVLTNSRHLHETSSVASHPKQAIAHQRFLQLPSLIDIFSRQDGELFLPWLRITSKAPFIPALIRMVTFLQRGRRRHLRRRPIWIDYLNFWVKDSFANSYCE